MKDPATASEANPDNPARDSSPDLVSSTSSDQFRVRVSSEGDAGPASSTAIDRFDRTNDHAEERVSGRGPEAPVFSGSDGKSLLSEFDDYVAATRRKIVGHGFEVGDMVWGKVKSHPWWPGHIYNEAFASPAVRRTKREGHVLVAFFGDSSYGWFEPSELIPFGENFAEKSRQLSSRNFQKAVEEAVDEASRRCGLGLVCKCRNPNNFRPTNVEDYFSIIVPDYEPGVYSDAQIRRARMGFEPSEMLAFVRQLALSPHDGDQRSFGYAKSKATVCAFRRAVFEQHDETYAQAFGVRPSSASDSPANRLEHPVRHTAKAPLTGPMVIAENLGGEKSSTKSFKVKEKFKKDQYLFKRRDEPSNSFQSASKEDPPVAAGSYILQKRPLAVSVAPQALDKHEDTRLLSQDVEALAGKSEVSVVEQVQPDAGGSASQENKLDAKPYLHDKGQEPSEEITRNIEPNDVASKSTGRPDFSEEMTSPSIVDDKSQSTNTESKITIDVKKDGNGILSESHEDFQQTEQRIQAMSNDVKHIKPSAEGVLKKIKAHKRPAEDLNSETLAMEGKKKKKMKKGLNPQPTLRHLEKPSTYEKAVQPSGRLIGKPVSVGLSPREDLPSEPGQLDVSSSNLTPMDPIAEVNTELPQLLGDLQALALDPFHGVKRGIPAAVRQFFLRFRSLVYQKSLSVSPPTVTENEAAEVRVVKPPSSVGASDSSEDLAKASPLVKSVKHVRPDDPAKAGRKRAISDRQEEITAKRLKKIKDLKALAAEKKASSQRTPEARQAEGKESVVQVAPKIMKPDLTRKAERPAKPVEPTMLVIKFPPETSLPSVAELKARFARFGPIDQSGLRVFWKTSTCRVVFLHKGDAQSAYRYALANPSLFGTVGVRYLLREVDSSSEVSDAAKVRGDNGANVALRIKDPVAVQRPALASSQQPLPQPVIPLKSILKKSTVDELGQGNGNGSSGKGTPRVKFVLGGEESTRGEQIMVGNRNNVNSASFADAVSSSPVAMDFNSKNVQKPNSQPSLPSIAPPTQSTKIPQHKLHNSEMALRITPNFINTTVSATATTVDISQQMISLLTRCNDVVSNLTGVLGYVPYHPL